MVTAAGMVTAACIVTAAGIVLEAGMVIIADMAMEARMVIEARMVMAAGTGGGHTIEEASGSDRDGGLGGVVPSMGAFFRIRTMRRRPSSSSNLLQRMSSRRLNPRKRTIGITARTPKATTLTSNSVRTAG